MDAPESTPRIEPAEREVPGADAAVPGGDGPSCEAWPPRVTELPRLPYAPEQDTPLRLDARAVPPPEPEFAPGKLAAYAPKVGSSRPPSNVVVYDPKNPSGRTRADSILRPNEDDRRRRVFSRRRRAMITGALVVGAVLLVLRSLPPIGWIAMMAAGALGGLVANERSDTEVSWSVSLALLGLPLGLSHGVSGMLICSCFFAAAGWLTGMLRDADMS